MERAAECEKALTEIEEAIEKGDTDDDNLNGNA